MGRNHLAWLLAGIVLLLSSTFAGPPVRAQSSKTPLAVADAETPDVRAEITQLKRGGGTLTLRFTIINGSGKKFGNSCGYRASSGEDCGKISGVHLLDPVNKKKYLVIRDARNSCVCGKIGVIAPGAKLNLWAKFPAPPAGVTSLSVVIPHFIPVDDVPIQP